MPELKPFRAFMYNSDLVPLDDVVAPPYDVISPSQQLDLYRRHPQNVIRLILGAGKDPYTDAGGYWKAWKRDTIIRQDDAPALYLISQRYSLAGGATRDRTGFIASCRLEELGRGTIFPHEKTLASPKEDRMKLIRATDALFSQIFAVYADPEHYIDTRLQQVMNRAPDLSCTSDGVLNRLWRIHDQKPALELATFMKHNRVFIADGHHRYETALSYASDRRLHNPAHTGKEPYNFIPLYCTNLHNDGLTILPPHRVLHDLPDYSPERILKGISGDFSVETVGNVDALLEPGPWKASQIQFGMALRGDPKLYRLRLEKERMPQDASIPAVLEILDVTLLQSRILKKILGMTDEDIHTKKYINYVIDPSQALRAVREEDAQVVFFIHPPAIEQVKAVAESGLVMPQKSTYFYPKLLSGLVMYSFGEE